MAHARACRARRSPSESSRRAPSRPSRDRAPISSDAASAVRDSDVEGAPRAGRLQARSPCCVTVTAFPTSPAPSSATPGSRSVRCTRRTARADAVAASVARGRARSTWDARGSRRIGWPARWTSRVWRGRSSRSSPSARAACWSRTPPAPTRASSACATARITSRWTSCDSDFRSTPGSRPTRSRSSTRTPGTGTTASRPAWCSTT